MSELSSLVAQSGGTPLTILAGLPDGIASDVCQRLVVRYRRNLDGHPRRLFHVLTGGKEGGRYSRHTVKGTINNLAKQIELKHRKSEREGKFNPSHVSIVYLSPNNAAEEDIVLNYFFLFCRCIPIQKQENRSWSEYSNIEFQCCPVKLPRITD